MEIRGFGLNDIRPLVALAAVAALIVGAAGSVAAAPAPAAGATTAYYNIGGPGGIVTGPDGNLWFTNGSNDNIGKITPAGVVSLYRSPGNISQPNAIIAGPDGDLWFTNNGWGGGNMIGRITPSGVITSYSSAGIRALRDITVGPDGAMWFTSNGDPAIGRITTDGAITFYTDPGIQGPEGITAGSDGGLWFTEDSGNIGRIDPTTKAFSFRDLTGSGIVGPSSIVTGPDGQLWFANQGTQDESTGNQIDASIGHMSPTTGEYGIYTDPSIFEPVRITVGPDDNLWFTNQSTPTDCPPCGTTPSIGQITTAGVISNFTDASPDKPSNNLDQPYGITTGPDGALWFANSGGGGLGGTIGRMTIGGTFSVYKGNGMYAPNGIVSGPDGALWFANSGGGTGNPSFSSIGRIATNGAITYFSDPADIAQPNIAQPFAIIVGPDENLWFTNNGWGGGDMIGRITPSGTLSSYSTGGNAAVGITNGPDGAMWFTSPSGRAGGPTIGRLTTGGTLTSYSNVRLTGPNQITTGPDGALWFTDVGSYDDQGNPIGISIGRVTTNGSFSFYSDPRIQSPQSIVTGPDGALWFTNVGTYDDQGNPVGGSIGRITTNGKLKFYTDTSVVSPFGITSGPDGALWFTDNAPSNIGRITTAGKISSYTAISPTPQSQITTGPDGAMWFTEMNNVIGRMDTAVTPEITGFTPATGAVGTKVTITGVNLSKASRVAFGGTTAAIVSNTSTKIVVRVPVGAVTGPVTVTTSIGTATSPGTFAVA
jgi:virginiamycin B lyase